MKLHRPDADVYVPDGSTIASALARTTHLCIAAHQDDIEIMAYHGIAACHGRDDAWFTGVVVNDGAGSPRSGEFANYTNEQMVAVRREEQREAARLGGFAAVIQLAHPGADIRDPQHPGVVDDLSAVLAAMRPQTVYLHNPADKHDTHIAVFWRSLAALRALPADRRPARVLGCEVWRDLDWVLDDEKQALDVSANPQLAADLIAVFRSQIAGGKRYDLATAGRRLANATYHTAHQTDRAAGLTWALDLTELVKDERRDVEAHVLGVVDRFRADVAARLARYR